MSTNLFDLKIEHLVDVNKLIWFKDGKFERYMWTKPFYLIIDISHADKNEK